MPKNNGRNAFYFFMRDWKIRAEKRGAVFPQGLRDVQQDPDCSADWKNLSKQEKGKYEAMAKRDKIASQVSNVKRTCLGEDIEVVKAKEREEEQFKERMNKHIESLVNKALREGNLASKTFVLIYTDYFFKEVVGTDKIVYFPAEYAVSIFSLERGIQETQNIIVSAPIPLGYKREAMERHKDVHGIPVEYPGGYKSFAEMYEKLISFLSPYKDESNKFPPFYTTSDHLMAVRSLLERLCRVAKQDTEQFVVYELELLYLHMGKELYKKKENRSVAQISIFAKHIFKRYTYISDLGSECAFHKYSTYSTACSSFMLQRWVWTLCEEFCDTLGIDVIPGVHRPKGKKYDNFPSISSLNVTSDSVSTINVPETASIMSLTNVSEQHRIKVSSRTYEEEVRRRKESAPIEIIKYTVSEDDDTNINEACSGFNRVSLDEPEKTSTRPASSKRVPTYFNEKPMKPPNVDSCASLNVNNDATTCNPTFPNIGGRGKMLVSRPTAEEIRKAMGRGRGHVN